MSKNHRSPYIIALLSGVAAALLYLTGYFGIFFLLPLELLIRRHGIKYSVRAWGSLLLSLSVARIILGGSAFSLLQEIAVVTFLIGGLLFFHHNIHLVSSFFLSMGIPSNRKIYRLLIISVVLGISLFPLAWWLTRDNSFYLQIKEWLTQSLTRSRFELGATETEQIDLIVRLSINVLLSTVVPLATLMIAATWYIGNLMNRSRPHYRRYPLEQFRAPSQLLWPTLVSYLALLMVSRTELQFLSYLVWNVSLTLSLCYFFQGVAIIIFYLQKRISHSHPEILLSFLFICAALLPIVNLILYSVTMIIGIADYWVDIRGNQRNMKKHKESEKSE